MLRVHRVGATLSLPPVGIENKSQNRSLGLDQQERYPGQLLAACSQTNGSPAEALPNQCAGWCCIDWLSWQRLPEKCCSGAVTHLEEGVPRVVCEVGRPNSLGEYKVISAVAPEVSFIPIFIARLDQLKALASGLRELPQLRSDELQSLPDRAQELVEE